MPLSEKELTLQHFALSHVLRRALEDACDLHLTLTDIANVNPDPIGENHDRANEFKPLLDNLAEAVSAIRIWDL